MRIGAGSSCGLQVQGMRQQGDRRFGGPGSEAPGCIVHVRLTSRLYVAQSGFLERCDRVLVGVLWPRAARYRLSSGKGPRQAARSCERMRCPASVISFRSVAHADLWIPLCGYCLWGATSSPGLPFQGKICPWLQQQASVGQPSWMAPLARCSPTPKEGWACSLMLLSAGEPRRLCGLKASKHSSEKSV